MAQIELFPGCDYSSYYRSLMFLYWVLKFKCDVISPKSLLIISKYTIRSFPVVLRQYKYHLLFIWAWFKASRQTATIWNAVVLTRPTHVEPHIHQYDQVVLHGLVWVFVFGINVITAFFLASVYAIYLFFSSGHTSCIRSRITDRLNPRNP